MAKFIEPLETRVFLSAVSAPAAIVQTGAVTGFIINDQTGKPMILARVFLDPTQKGYLQGFEPSVLTNAIGQFTFKNVPIGPQYVAQEVPTGYVQTSPQVDLFATVTHNGDVSAGVFGDTPLSPSVTFGASTRKASAYYSVADYPGVVPKPNPPVWGIGQAPLDASPISTYVTPTFKQGTFSNQHIFVSAEADQTSSLTQTLILASGGTTAAEQEAPNNPAGYTGSYSQANSTFEVTFTVNTLQRFSLTASFDGDSKSIAQFSFIGTPEEVVPPEVDSQGFSIYETGSLPTGTYTLKFDCQSSAKDTTFSVGIYSLNLALSGF